MSQKRKKCALIMFSLRKKKKKSFLMQMVSSGSESRNRRSQISTRVFYDSVNSSKFKSANVKVEHRRN